MGISAWDHYKFSQITGKDLFFLLLLKYASCSTEESITLLIYTSEV